MGWVAAVAVVVVLVALVVAGVALARRRERAWRAFARRHGLRYQPRGAGGGPAVTGLVEGRPVELAVTESSSDTGVLDVQDMKLSVALLGWVPDGLEVRARTIAPEAGIATGDAAFDEAASVTAVDEDAARRYLDPYRRRALAGLIERAPQRAGGVRKGAVFVRDRGTSRTADTWDERLALLLETARELDRRSP